MKRFAFLLLLIQYHAFAQVIPAHRNYDWDRAGYQGTMPSPAVQVDITNFGAIGTDSISDYPAVNNAINSLGGNPGIIYIPQGTFYFDTTINLPSGVIFRGAGSTKTKLRFHLGQNPDNCIQVNGSATQSTAVTGGMQKGSNQITVSNPTLFLSGQYAEISQNNGSWDTNPVSWATKSVGQIVKINNASASGLTFDQTLRIDFSSSLNPEIKGLNMVNNVGIECLYIERLDAPASGGGSNIAFNYAANCWVYGIESNKSVGSHINVHSSINLEIKGNYIHHAFTYEGTSTRGYGIALHYHTSECLVENNIFVYLRHAMMVKTGANGNVFGYNYSTDVNQDVYPFDASGDISLHGHYPFANLFEGNIVQNITIDHYWGPSGPHNTFFRNRAQLWGIQITNNSVKSDSQNLVGNEVSYNLGLYGQYSLTGSNHFEFGNDVQGTITPAGTSNLTDNSYYLSSKPVFWDIADPWPPLGPPNTVDSKFNPAYYRYTTCGIYTICPYNVSVKENEKSENIRVYPNPSSNLIHLELPYSANEFPTICFYNLNGKLVKEMRGTKTITVEDLSSGVYLIKVIYEEQIYITRFIRN
jgi:hypothetical protein